MGVGGKGSSESKQNTTNDNDFYDQRIAVSEGGQAVGAGASGNIINDASIITKMGDALKVVTQDTVKAGVDNVDRALDFGDDTVRESFGFGRDALSTVERTVQQANDLLARTSEGYTNSLQDNSGPATSAVVANFGKYALIAATGLAALYILKKAA